VQTSNRLIQYNTPICESLIYVRARRVVEELVVIATHHNRACAETPVDVPMSRGHTRRGCWLVATTAGARLGVILLSSVIALWWRDTTTTLAVSVRHELDADGIHWY